MVLRINFSGVDEFDINSSFKKVNGFINKLFGENNQYHGKFSNYSVSKLQNGVYIGSRIIFTNGAFLTISSNDDKVIDKLINGILRNRNDLRISNLIFEDFDCFENDVHSSYDLIRTTSPIRLCNKEKFITFNDDEFIPYLTEKSIKKLVHNGLSEECAKTLKLELFHKENAKTHFYNIDGAKNICSQVMMIVRGDKEARKAIYELGFGSSTGFGFGSVEIIDNKYKK